MQNKNYLHFAPIALAVPLMVLLAFLGLSRSVGLLAEQSSSCELSYESAEISFDDAKLFEAYVAHLLFLMNRTGIGAHVAHHIQQLDVPPPQKVLERPRCRIRPRKAYAEWGRMRRSRPEESIELIWPVSPEKFWVSSSYGPRTLNGTRSFHKGIDLAAPTGTPALSAAAGTVTVATATAGYGKLVEVTHKEGFKTRYAHLDAILVKQGDKVSAGELIGKVGATGNVSKSRWGKSASHLHFEVYHRNKHMNPLTYL